MPAQPILNVVALLKFKYMQKNLKNLLIIFILSIILIPNFVNANISDEIMDKVGGFKEKIGLPGDARTTTPITIIINLINVALGLLGLFFVILIMYAGFTWMTAQGDEKKVQKAKDIIKNSIYGVAIVLLAAVLANLAIEIILRIAEGEEDILNSGG